MDPIHYDRIADLLCQIRAKVENNLRTTHKKGEFTKEHYIMKVIELLESTDRLADLDQNGML